jgi:protein-disulfide isomerase
MGRKRREVGRQRHRQAKQQQSIVVGVSAIILIGAVIYFTWQGVGGGNALAPESVADPVLGGHDAVVEIVEYGDFGCPACRAWHNRGIREQVMADFGEQVKFVWRDFPVITRQSPKAAEAGQCAGAQGQFWVYHDFLYEMAGGLDTPELKRAASEVGLDMDAFNTCLDESIMAAKVQDNAQQARRLGMRGTPAFTINGQPLAAPPSYEQLASYVLQVVGQ